VQRSRACLAVLSFEGRDLLARTLPSIVSQRGSDFDVVVVDNGSTDDTAGYLARDWPGVRVVALEANVGVTAALNVCVRAGEGAEYVAILNNDVELEPDWLATLIATLESHPEAAAASGKLLRFHEREVIDRTGDLVFWSGAAFGRGAGETDQGQFDTAEEVFAVGGAAALFRTSAFERVGSFDERFFAYLEDVDWGFRCRLAGMTARYEPRARGYHMGGATLGLINPFSLYHLRRNVVWLVAKNHPAPSLLRHGWSVLAFLAAGLALSVRPRQLPVVLRAYFHAVRGLRPVLAQRREIQHARRAAPRDLEAVMAGPTRLW